MKTQLVRTFALAAGAALAVTGSATAQARLEGAANVEHLTYTFTGDAGRAQQGGVFLGLNGGIYFGALRLGLAGRFGSLAGNDSAAARSLRMTAAQAGFQATPWLQLGIEAQARREAADTAVVLQRLGGIYSRLTPMLGDNLQGVADLAFFPATSSTNVEAIGTALRAGIGARYAPGGGAVTIGLGYRLFRIDHAPRNGFTRLEQDEGVFFEVGIRR